MALGGFAAAAASFAAENILATIVGNASEQVFEQARQGIADVLRRGGRPVNHDLQRAVRKAYLQATLYLCECCGEALKRQLSVPAQMTRSFTPEINGLAHLYRQLGEELQQVGDDAYLLPSCEADKQSELLLQPSGAEEESALLRTRLREALLEELAARYDAQFGALPSRLVEMVEEGWEERGADEQLVRLYWFDLLCAFFAHELKFNPAVRDIFTSKALAQLLVNGQALTVSNIEARLAAQGGLVSQRLAEIDAQLATLSASQGAGFAEVLRVLDFWLPQIATSRDNDHEERLNQTLQTIAQQLEALQLPPQMPDLALAQARLASMPTDEQGELPPVRTLPSGSRMVFAPYRHFVGREAELRRLASILKGATARGRRGEGARGGESDPLISENPCSYSVAATGLGGIGKTQLAVEFAHRYGHYFMGGVFWLDFSSASGIDNEVARCGGVEGMRLQENFANLPLPDQVSLVQRAWQEALPRLLIFDNCEEEQLVDQWRPITGGCRVLITSRRGHWAPARAIQQVALDTLTPTESSRLLGSLAPHLSLIERHQVARRLGHFPLALHLAGSFLQRYQEIMTVTTYLAELKQALLRHPSLTGRGNPHSPTKHEQHVAQTFALSWERLDEDDPIDQLAQQLLLHAAHFAPSVPIPPALLLATLERGALTLPETEHDNLSALDYADALSRLVELGLLEKTVSQLTIHRLVAAFAQMEPQHDDARQQVEEALLKEASRLNQAGYPAPLQAWQTHLRHLTDAALKREDEIAASLCNEMAVHLDIVADYKNARPYYEHALAINEKVLGAEHPDTAGSLNNLGYLLHAMGDYEGARRNLERALAIDEKVLGPEHPNTAMDLNNLGALIRAMGDYESARPYYERALAIREKVLGAEHPYTATSLNNLGSLLRAMGDYESARPVYERALAINEKVLGAEHPSTARSLNNLGGLFDSMGDYKSARPVYERALAINEKVLGAEHPSTARSLNNLGMLLQAMGEYESARSYYERALAIFEKRLGATHPHTQIVRRNLEALEGG